MSDTEPSEVRAKSLLGYSQGHWEDSTLVVVTSAIDWADFDKEGIPQGDAMSVVERHWVWRPGEEVKPYDCTWGN